MFIRISALFFFILFALPLFAAATAVQPYTKRQEITPIPASQCNTGDIQCCNSVQEATSSIQNLLGGLLGLVLGPLEGLIGFNCGGISILGLGGNSCTQQPVCCSNNTFGGLISLGCIPININL